MTPEDRNKAIETGYFLAARFSTIDIQKELSELTEEELVAGWVEQTTIILSPLATYASVLGAATRRHRLHAELVMRNALKDYGGAE